MQHQPSPDEDLDDFGQADDAASLTEELAKNIAFCQSQRNPLNAFNDVILRRPPLWKQQRAIGLAMNDPVVTDVVVAAGHSVGKSFFAAGAVLGLQHLHLDSLVMTTSPSNTQLNGVLWKEIRKARSGAPLIRNNGRLTKLPNHLDLGDGWSAYGFATNQTERMQGFHASGGPMFMVIDEASGIKCPAMVATIKSLKARKTLWISNPLYDHGPFFDMARRAEDDPSVRLVRIPSTDSPDINLWESPRGLADQRWLRGMIADYGVDSETFRVRVLAQFPTGAADLLIPSSWLDRAEKATHIPSGPRWLGIDISECTGADMAVLVVRDSNGIIDFRAGNRGGFAWIASQAKDLIDTYNIDPSRVVFDQFGPGADFANRLAQVGVVGARPYRGGRPSKSTKWHCLRDACHWMLRRRLNPHHAGEDGRIPPAFAIPSEYLKRMRAELREITYTTNEDGENQVRLGLDVRAALRFSPDFTDALTQSFMSPNS